MAANVIGMAVEERGDLLELLRTLDESQWDAPTLCEGWAVRDVVAHVVSYEGLSVGQLVSRFAQGMFRLSRVNQSGLAPLRDAPPEALLDALERNLQPAGLTTAFGGRVALIDALVHHQDIRRPLGLSRAVPRSDYARRCRSRSSHRPSAGLGTPEASRSSRATLIGPTGRAQKRAARVKPSSW